MISHQEGSQGEEPDHLFSEHFFSSRTCSLLSQICLKQWLLADSKVLRKKAMSNTHKLEHGDPVQLFPLMEEMMRPGTISKTEKPRPNIFNERI